MIATFEVSVGWVSSVCGCVSGIPTIDVGENMGDAKSRPRLFYIDLYDD